MNFRFTVLETSVNRAEFRWKWLRFVRFTSIYGLCIVSAVLLFGTAIILGWLTSKTLAITLLAILAGIASVGWLIGVMIVLASQPDRHWLVAAIEQIDRRLLDRLNTLLFLEDRRNLPHAQSFASRIARQAQGVLSKRKAPAPFSARPQTAWFGSLVAAVIGLVLLNHLFSPWQLLSESNAPRGGTDENPPPPPPLELAVPETNNVEEVKTWGEVRITDPGMDLRVTKVDVVPLQIEIAANERLQTAHWFTAINGGAETDHTLPAPAEPRFAIYRPDIYLDEFNLADWDVVTYYARATTERSNSYASEVYFLEVRPFREDIAKMPGGEGGQAYRQLNQISGLISRQQHVIRQTHQHLQSPPRQEKLRSQDRQKLGDAELDLGQSTRHLYAEMATELENRPIGEALDNLAKAEQSLNSAGGQLHTNAMPEAQQSERSALTELIAARKMFQKAVSDNPDAFQEQPEAEDPTPVADLSQKLNQMAEFRNEAKAAQELIQKTLEQQRSLEQRAKSAPLSQYPRLAEEQSKLTEELAQFEQQHPAPFKGAEAEATAAQRAMDQAAKSLEARRSPGARKSAEEARSKLEQLAQKMESTTGSRQLADAYRLKQMLDQEAATLTEGSKPDSNVSGSELQKTAREAKQTLEQLKKTAEQEPTRSAFGQPLRDALSDPKKAELDEKLKQLELASEESSQREAAGQAGRALADVGQAFEASQPNSLQMARKNDSLKPEQGSLTQGLAELESLIKQLEKEQLSQDAQARQAREALADLQSGMRSQFGDNEQGAKLLQQLEQMLKPETGLDPGDLRGLLKSLQHLSAETHQELARKEDEPEVNNIDPANLPPAYRSRIQKYFQKLSER